MSPLEREREGEHWPPAQATDLTQPTQVEGAESMDSELLAHEADSARTQPSRGFLGQAQADDPLSRLRLNRAELFRQLGYLPHAGQAQVHASKAPRRVLACGVRWGKTMCAAMEAIAAALEPRAESLGWIVAPTYDLSDRVFRQVLKAVHKNLSHRILLERESEHRLVLRNFGGGISEIRTKSADHPTSLLGEGLDYVILDEAARTKPVIWESYLSQRLIDRRGWALLISTPNGKGWFYDAWRRGQPGGDPNFESWNQPTIQNPTLDPEEVEGQRQCVPEHVYRQEYLAQFVEGAGSVFRDVREVASGEFEAPKPKARYYAGLDLAKVNDYTVLTVMDEQCRVVYIDRFQRINWELQLERVKSTLTRYNNAHVVVDATGVGDPICDALKKPRFRVHPYPLTSNSKQALINNLALAIERRTVVLPAPSVFPECVEELEAYEYSISEFGNYRMGSPYGMHDDVVISVALALWATRLQPPLIQFGVMVGNSIRIIHSSRG